MNILARLEKRGGLFWTIAGLIGVAGVGVADVLTGRELAFSSFYLIPIVLVTWFSGRNLGLVMGGASTVTWFIADALAGQAYSAPGIGYWNAAVRLSFFATVALLLPALKSLRHEKELARLDDLTGAANRRHFFEVAQAELDRAARYKRPFTIAYIDIDDFKNVNDQWGHQVGDQLLCAIVQLIKQNVRKTDFLAWFGGDEFVLLLPETDPAAAQPAVSKIHSALLEGMRAYKWGVAFSMGVVTCTDAHPTADELIREADILMYSVKKDGKNAIAYATLPARTPEPVRSG